MPEVVAVALVVYVLNGLVTTAFCFAVASEEFRDPRMFVVVTLFWPIIFALVAGSYIRRRGR